MHPATVRGIGVHFAVAYSAAFRHFFAPFKESMTLNLAQRSSEVINFDTNRKRVYILIVLIVLTTISGQ